MQGDAVSFGVEEDAAVVVRAEGVFGLKDFAAGLLYRLLILHRHAPVSPVILPRCG